jgi:hypothetical protein
MSYWALVLINLGLAIRVVGTEVALPISRCSRSRASGSLAGNLLRSDFIERKQALLLRSLSLEYLSLQ